MFDDIIIGEGNHGSGSIKLMDITEKTHHISQNGVSFWITHIILDMDMIVFKNTQEGIHLQELISRVKSSPSNASKNAICKFIDTIALKNVSVYRLNEEIKTYGKNCFEEGRQAKLLEIKKAMDLDAYNF